uniref:Ig-like domain-containing protein n=1 Tax=Paramormyrops kingsleyae TaxID=1676925 RepID=A0A3B3QI81_9TELE
SVTPGQPGTPEVTAITRSTMTVVWDKPGVDGGSLVIGYCLEKRNKKSLRWQKVFRDPEEENISSDPKYDIHNTESSTLLVINQVTRNDTGKYILHINNGVGEPKTVTVSVKQPPIIEVTVKLGQHATLKCQIIGRPLPEIKWYRHGKELLESRKYAMSSDGRTHSLKVLADAQEDEGIYTCKAVNEAGETETSGKLVLEAPPQINPGYPLKEKYYAGCGTSLRLHVNHFSNNFLYSTFHADSQPKSTFSLFSKLKIAAS